MPLEKDPTRWNVPREMAFAESEYRERVRKVKKRMADVGLDALLVHNQPNLLYLAGYQTPISNRYACLILPADGDPAIQLAEIELAAALSTGWVKDVATFPFWDSGLAIDRLAELLRERGLDDTTIGVEPGVPGLTGAQYARLTEVLPSARLVDVSRLVYQVRKVKSAAEMEYIRKAAAITRKSIDAAIGAIAPGATDNDLAAAALHRMMTEGGEYPNTAPFISTGARTGLPHTTNKRVPIAVGDHVFLEVAAVYQRYNAAMVRTAVLGPPSEMARRLEDAVLTTLDRLFSGIRPGRTGHDVAMEAKKGWAKVASDAFFSGCYGYSVGLGLPPGWGEDLIYIAEGVDDQLEAGMVFHLPIAYRVPGELNVGISESVVVTSSGCDILTGTERDLIVVPA